MGHKEITRFIALFLSAVAFTSLLLESGLPALAQTAPDTWISDSQLTDNNTAAPAADSVTPNANQYEYQKQELAAFVHFGPNTFNEIEWGENYGDKSPDQIFTLEQDFDEETLVKSLAEAGFKKVIVTAKHHDGFCIWDSQHTDYDVAATSYTNAEGESDILAEISAACTKYDLDMGLYLSPWDIHDPSYGYYDKNGNPTSKENDYLDYNEYYKSQLIEILSNEKYGNDGHFVEVWMDGAKGSGADAQEYNFQDWYETIQRYEGVAAGYKADCMLFGAGAYTTARWIGNESGYSAFDTWAKSTVNTNNNTINSNTITDNGYKVTAGVKNGNQWTVPEADARITSGWFWGTKKSTPKSITELGNMYFNTVGHNSVLLLNVPPNDQGTVDQAILDRVAEFGENIRETFQSNLAAANGATVVASSVRGNDLTYGPGKVVDGDDSTYWTPADGSNRGSLLIDLGGVKNIDVVSIEEAIQLGQCIDQYQVEYRNGENDSWKTMGSGEAVGSKRLIRTATVRATQVRITVSCSSGRSPILSEVGVYKASEGFQLSGNLPADLEIIDNVDKTAADGSYFEYGNLWKQESGTNFINGTGMWANPSAQTTIHFIGTKAYLIGTTDPNHGTADIYIDGVKVTTIDTHASTRSLGQVIYETPLLSDGSHTLKVVVKNKAIGIDALAVINNSGAGMFELEYDAYTMDEASEIQVKVKRVGGSSGQASVLVSNEPGSAVQGDMDPDQQTLLIFEPGETEKTATVTTQRNTQETGDQYFTVTLTAKSGNAGIGFNGSARVTISDAEQGIVPEIAALISSGEEKLADWYVSGWDHFSQALELAKEIIVDSQATMTELRAAKDALEQAASGLQARVKYTEADPFHFPWQPGSSATLEAEFATSLYNDTSNDRGYSLNVTNGNWASNGKFLNSLNYGDKAVYAYEVSRPGTYHVTLYFRSGSTANGLKWSSFQSGQILSGSIRAGASSVSQVKTVSFDFQVTQAGPGQLVLEAPTGNAPQLDRLVITPGDDVDYLHHTITASATAGGSITDPGETVLNTGESKTYFFTADPGYEVRDVVVNGVSHGSISEYTVTDISENVNISVSFEFANYTEDNRFVFPGSTGSATVEAEHFTLSNTGGDHETYRLEKVSASWASNGKFVNSMNSGDSISLPYTAEAGRYEFTVTYRSGSVYNRVEWSEKDGKIAANRSSVNATDNAKNTHTITFVVDIITGGDGTLILTAPSTNAPQLDKFEIRKIG